MHLIAETERIIKYHQNNTVQIIHTYPIHRHAIVNTHCIILLCGIHTARMHAHIAECDHEEIQN